MKMTIKVLLHDDNQLLFFLDLPLFNISITYRRLSCYSRKDLCKGRAVGGMGHTIVLSQKDMVAPSDEQC